MQYNLHDNEGAVLQRLSRLLSFSPEVHTGQQLAARTRLLQTSFDRPAVRLRVNYGNLLLTASAILLLGIRFHRSAI